KGFATTGRPGEIHTWVKNARKGTPVIKDVDAFIKQWGTWWKAINPQWRLVDGVLSRGGEGSWEGMRVPGQNGFLSVLIGLKWWREKAARAGGEEWKEAVRDVAWV
ncbi:hypothetical protein B0H11DRAFT_1615572, partial [Mycena galericulata]